jgi:hypothetical protein
VHLCLLTQILLDVHVSVSSEDRLYVTLQEACDQLRRCYSELLHGNVQEFLQNVVFPPLLAENWKASSKYFGGRVPSHSITFFFSDVFTSAKRSIAYDDGTSEALEDGVRRRDVIVEMFEEKILQFLQRYFSFAVTVELSDTRRFHLACDIWRIVRSVRLLRRLFTVSNGVAIGNLLLQIVAVISVKSCSPSQAQEMSSCSATSSKSLPADESTTSLEEFVEKIWRVAPIVSWGVFFSLGMQQVSLITSQSFVGYISQEQLQRIPIPSPFTHLSTIVRIDSSQSAKLLFETLPRCVIEQMTC